jgi:hypothetical protein
LDGACNRFSLEAYIILHFDFMLLQAGEAETVGSGVVEEIGLAKDHIGLF